MKDRILRIAAAVVFLIGGACIAYPYASDWTYQLAKQGVIERYEAQVEQAAEGDSPAELERARRYNERLRAGRTAVIDPFDPDQPRDADSAEYWAALNIGGDGVMGVLTIPAIDLELPVYHGTGSAVLSKGVGHVENTTLPTGDPFCHSVIAGHTGLPSCRIFDALDRVEVGDYFVLSVLGTDLAYRVDRISVVLPTETGGLAAEPDLDLVTLVTCTPYGVNDHRLLVRGKRCELPAEWVERGADLAQAEQGAPLPAGPGALLIILACLAVLAIGAYRVMGNKPRTSSKR